MNALLIPIGIILCIFWAGISLHMLFTLDGSNAHRVTTIQGKCFYCIFFILLSLPTFIVIALISPFRVILKDIKDKRLNKIQEIEGQNSLQVMRNKEYLWTNKLNFMSNSPTLLTLCNYFESNPDFNQFVDFCIQKKYTLHTVVTYEMLWLYILETKNKSISSNKIVEKYSD